MKKAFLTTFLIFFVLIGFSGRSFAFGSRGHGHGNGPGQFGDSSWNGKWDQNWDQDLDQHLGTNGDVTKNQDKDFDTKGFNTKGFENKGFDDKGFEDKGVLADESTNKDCPISVVPEPMSVSLLALGLVGLLFKQRIRTMLQK